MKILSALMVFVTAGSALASTPNAILHCRKGDNEQAVVVTLNSTPGENSHFLSINDEEIIRTLGLEGSNFSSPSKYSLSPYGAYGYLALAGRGATGVFLRGDNGGMKLVWAQSAQGGIVYNESKNYYFPPGACSK